MLVRSVRKLAQHWSHRSLADAVGLMNLRLIHRTTESIAKREGCSVRKVNMTISLAFLAPDLVKAAIEGRLPHGMGVARLADLPAEWSRQHEMLGLPFSNTSSSVAWFSFVLAAGTVAVLLVAVNPVEVMALPSAAAPE